MAVYINHGWRTHDGISCIVPKDQTRTATGHLGSHLASPRLASSIMGSPPLIYVYQEKLAPATGNKLVPTSLETIHGLPPVDIDTMSMSLELETHRRDLVNCRDTRHHLALPEASDPHEGVGPTRRLSLYWTAQAGWHPHGNVLHYNLIRYNISEHRTNFNGYGSSCLVVVGLRDGVWGLDMHHLLAAKYMSTYG